MATLTGREGAADGSRTDGRYLRVALGCANRSGGRFLTAFLREAMAARDLVGPRAGEYHDTACIVGVFESVESAFGPHTVERFGRRLAAVLDWPARTDDVADALQALDRVYDAHHRGDAGGYGFAADGSGGTLTSTTPFPVAFERGVVYGIDARFGRTGAYLSLQVTDECDLPVNVDARLDVDGTVEQDGTVDQDGTVGRDPTVYEVSVWNPPNRV